MRSSETVQNLGVLLNTRGVGPGAWDEVAGCVGTDRTGWDCWYS